MSEDIRMHSRLTFEPQPKTGIAVDAAMEMGFQIEEVHPVITLENYNEIFSGQPCCDEARNIPTAIQCELMKLISERRRDE